jgi:Transposase, Mutator family
VYVCSAVYATSPEGADVLATHCGEDPFAAEQPSLGPVALTAYLRFPAEHHHRIRHANFIERTFGETRRRAKVIGRFPGETSCIIIVWAVLDRAWAAAGAA